MSKQRDLVQEIIEIRSRNKSGPAQGELFLRLTALQQAFEGKDDTNEELLKYFPIAMVACIEGYFRLVIKEIIDSGEPYIENASKLVEKGRFNYDVAKAFHGQKISLGEFVSHMVSINNLSGISTNMSALLDVDYFEELSTVHDRWAHEIHGKPKKPIIENIKDLKQKVAKTFELRHIFCHELANKNSIDRTEIENCFNATLVFIKAADEYHYQKLFPNAPLSQSDMNQQAASDFSNAKKKLETLNAKIAEILPRDRNEEYLETHKLWQIFRDKDAEFHANEYKGGSIWPTIYGSTAAASTEQRVKVIEKYLAILEEFGGDRP